MECPEYKARPERNYRVNEFITPDDSAIMKKAEELRKTAEEKGQSIIEACFNFVSLEIDYAKDKWQHGHEEYWLFPRETLERKLGDCEDTSFLLDSLLLASGLGDKDVRVALGRYGTYGHAWVESLTDRLLTKGGWHILETTSDERLKIGRNAWRVEEGYEGKYSPELYVFRYECEPVGKRALYDHYPLYYPSFFRNIIKKLSNLFSQNL